MKKHHRTIISITITVAVIGTAYFLFLYRMSYSQPKSLGQKKGMEIEQVYENIDLDTNSKIWNQVQPISIHLVPQSARVAFGRSEKDILVKAIFNDVEVAFLVEIKDDTEDLGGLTNPDSCAIMLAQKDVSATTQMMGYDSKVNIWQWAADRNAARYHKGDRSANVIRELIAEGPTTQRSLANEYVEWKGSYDDSTWRIIFKRKLSSRQADEFEIEPGTEMNIAFAVWDGSKVESFSRKSISILMPLVIGATR